MRTARPHTKEFLRTSMAPPPTKEMVSVTSLSDVEVLYIVLRKAHSIGLEKNERTILKGMQNSVIEVLDQIERQLATLTAVENIAPATLGIPSVGAQWRHARECGACNKSFTAFHRGQSCHGCGHTFCQRCVATKLVLPKGFGYGRKPCSICDGCSFWFQQLLNKSFKEENHTEKDTFDSPKATPIESSIDDTKREGYASSSSTKLYKDEYDVLQKRPSRSQLQALSVDPLSNHSRIDDTALVDNAEIESKDLRNFLCHLNLAAKDGYISNRVCNEVKAFLVIQQYDQAKNSLEHIVSCTMASDQSSFIDDDENDEMDINSVNHIFTKRGNTAKKYKRANTLEKNKLKRQMLLLEEFMKLGLDQNTNESRITEFLSTSDTLSPDQLSSKESLMTADSDVPGSSIERPPQHPLLQSAKSTAIATVDTVADCNNKDVQIVVLPTSAGNTGDITAEKNTSCNLPNSPIMVLPPTNHDVDSNEMEDNVSELLYEDQFSTNAIPNVRIYMYRAASVDITDSNFLSTPYTTTIQPNCFDDHDINESFAAKDSNASNFNSSNNAHFAVYKIEGNDSFRHSLLGFTRKNDVLDRYMVEIVMAQGIVRAKCVFKHRFWSFRSDEVHALANSTLGLEYLKVQLRSNTFVERDILLQFSNEKERQEFVALLKECIQKSKQQLKIKKANSVHTNVNFNTTTTTSANTANNGIHNVNVQAENTMEKTTSLNSPISHTKIMHNLSSSANNVNIFTITEQHFNFIEKPILVHLLNGEKIASTSNSMYLASLLIGGSEYGKDLYGRIRGILLITNYRVIFIPYEKGHEIYPNTPLSTIKYIPLFAIIVSYIESSNSFKSKSSSKFSTNILSIVCKDARIMRIEIDGKHERQIEEYLSTLRDKINNLAEMTQSCHFEKIDNLKPCINKENQYFGFKYSLQLKSPSNNGWLVYDIDKEYKRQGIDFNSNSPLKLEPNIDGDICDSYPSQLLVPSSFSLQKLHAVTKFRAKDRLPVISWIHPRHKCVLTRSSQPLLGSIISGASSNVDQELVDLYRRMPDMYTSHSQNNLTSSRPVYIFDARKLKASTGNRILGKGGVETAQDYPNAVICHLNISNMYKMQSSYVALVKLCLPGRVHENGKSWHSAMESTRWFEHLQLVLEGSLKIARVLELEGASVLVHCSDGWDRTCQLVSLAQLMIDPYYRTIEGFIVLVEREWCSFGHKFTERLGGDRIKDTNRAKSSPIILQFLDAVWQIYMQFPIAFEFNELFLLHIANSLTSGLYGTFLYDSSLQRDMLQISNCTVSVWTPVLENAKLFQNSDYQYIEKPIWPWTSHQMLQLWKNYYFQWHPKFIACRWLTSK